VSLEEVVDVARVGGLGVDKDEFDDEDFKLATRWAVAGVIADICMGGSSKGFGFFGSVEDSVCDIECKWYETFILDTWTYLASLPTDHYRDTTLATIFVLLFLLFFLQSRGLFRSFSLVLLRFLRSSVLCRRVLRVTLVTVQAPP
jgi:hypothetical protein